MKQLICLLIVATISVTSTFAQKKINLFNGKNLDGWHMDVPELDTNKLARIPFIVRDNKLVSLGTPGGHLITNKQYENFELSFQYRFVGKPGNCGVLVFASHKRALYDMFPQSIEVQMMHENAGDFWCIEENIEVPDMEKRRGPKENWGINGNKGRRIVNLTDGTEKPLGEWNTMVVRCEKNTIKVTLNGVLVNHGFNATASIGQIALQAEGSEVEFKDLVLEQLKSVKKK